VRLATADQVRGGVNLYARSAHAFDEQSVQVAHHFTDLASTALAVVEKVEGLQTALQTRHLIGMAQGMLMLRYGLDQDQAFAFLSRTSSRTTSSSPTSPPESSRSFGRQAGGRNPEAAPCSRAGPGGVPARGPIHHIQMSTRLKPGRHLG
jgi:hypothetical protein